MVRKIGKLGANRAGTGKIEDSGTEKWTGSVAAQVATAANIKGIITKTIPVSYVVTDPENPRRLAISQTEITQIAQKHPIDKALLSADNTIDWIEDYVQKVGESENLTGKTLGDFESLVSFSAALKSPERMLHPIVVWKDESTFHLIAGERRLFAHILLGENHIAARIAETNYDRNTIDALQWEENVHRVDMNLWERVERVKKIIDAGEGINHTSVTKLSKVIGRSRAECQRYLAILRYPNDSLINAIKEGKVGELKKAAALAQLLPADLANLLSGEKAKSDKPRITFQSKDRVSTFGLIIKAAAEQLKLHNVVETADLTTAAGINTAIEALLREMEHSTRG